MRGNSHARCGVGENSEITSKNYLSLYDDYEEWSLSELRDRVKLVQELDSLADDLVSQAVHMAKAFDVVEEAYYVPQTRHVLVAK